MQVGLDKLKELFETLKKGEVQEFEYQDEAYQIRVAFQQHVSRAGAAPNPVVAAAVAPAGPAGDEAGIAYVTSPFVGTFYAAPAPDADPFVSPGEHVHAGQVLCIVEAMKLMNEIEAEMAGTVLEPLVENGQSVEFGQKLFRLKKG